MGDLLRSHYASPHTEFPTVPKLMEWAEKQGVKIQHIQPGQPQQNACIARYNRTIRREWLDQYITETIEEAQDFATQWLWT